MNVFSFLLILYIILYMYLGIYLLRFKENKTGIRFIFFVFCVLFSIWSLAYIFIFMDVSKETAYFWYRVSTFTWPYIAAFMAHIVLLLANDKKTLRHKWLYFALYIPGMIENYVALSGNLIIKDFQKAEFGWREILNTGTPEFTAVTINNVIFTIVTTYIIWKWKKRAKGNENKQITLIFCTMVPSVMLASILNMNLPKMPGYNYPSFGIFFAGIWMIGIWISIVKYRLIKISPEVIAEEVVTKMKDIFILLDWDNNIIEVNKKAEEIFEVKEADLIGKDVSYLLKEKNGRRLIEVLQQKDVKNKELEIEHEQSNGDKISLIFSVAKISDAEGAFAGTLIVCSDISEMKKLKVEMENREKTEKKLGESEEKFRTIAENLNDLIARYNITDGIIYKNPAMDRYFDEMKILSNSTNPEIEKTTSYDMADAFRKTLDVFKSGIEERITIKDKNKRWFDVKLIPEKGKNNKIENVMIVARDISEIKKIEEENKKAKEEAENALRIKSDFLAMMSHEIRTPMNGIIGMSSILEKSNLDMKQKKMVNTIKISGDILLKVINDILDFSKIEAGKLEIEKEIFEVKNCIENMNEIFMIEAHNKGLEFVVKIDDKIPQRIIGDLTRTSQVLTNLISNAIKFTEKGKISIEVEKIEESFEYIQLKFSVSDTGIGISEDKMEKLFKSFSQVDSSIARKYGGTGLGLVISQKIVELMGGKIGVRSKLGEGSIFYFTLKAKKAMPDFEYEKQEKKLEGSRDISILVAEDNPSNREVIDIILKSIGYDVDFASNGLEVIEMDSRKNYDLIFMDVHMPEMDGIEATKILRMVRGADELSIIALTADSVEDEGRSCMEIGMNGFVPKPIHIIDLQEAIDKRLNEMERNKNLL